MFQQIWEKERRDKERRERERREKEGRERKRRERKRRGEKGRREKGERDKRESEGREKVRLKDEGKQLHTFKYNRSKIALVAAFTHLNSILPLLSLWHLASLNYQSSPEVVQSLADVSGSRNEASVDVPSAKTLFLVGVALFPAPTKLLLGYPQLCMILKTVPPFA